MARRPKKYNIPKDKTLTGKEKAVIYTRVSSPSQMTEWDGLRWQERLCREWADNNDVEVVKVFSDWGKSGKYEAIEDRKGLSQMIEFLAEKNKVYTTIHFVLIDDMDRIIRDTQWWREIKAQIENKWGAKIYSLKQNLEDSPEGKLVQNIVMATKQHQRESNARQVKDKQRARMLNGYRPLNAPAWYTHKETRDQWKILIKDETAPIIQEALLWFAEGILPTQSHILDFLISKWYHTRRGNKPDLDFVADLLWRERLLRYAGFIHYEPRNISMVKGQHEKLFDIEIVAKILERLSPKPYYQKSSQTEIWEQLPLRGFLYDSYSGIKYSGWPSQGKKNRYMYYSCRIPKEQWGKKTINIMNTKIHEEFEVYLQLFKVDETTFILFEETMKTLWKKKNAITDALSADLTDRVKEIDDDCKKIMQLIRKSQSGKMIENYENEIIALEDEKTELLMKIGWQQKEETINIDDLISNTKAILRNPSFIRDLWNIQLQKMLIWILFNGKIYYDKDIGFQTPEIPLIYAIKKELSEDNSVLVDPRGVEPLTSSVQTRRSSQMS